MADERKTVSEQRQLTQKPNQDIFITTGGSLPETGEPFSLDKIVLDKIVLSDGLAVTLERLADLIFVEAEEGFPPPTRHAYLTAFHLLNEAYCYLPASFPRATVSVEENGGVFIYWIKPSITVQLTVPSEQGKLLYIRTMEDNTPSQVYQDADSKQLAERLLTFNRL